MNPEEEQNKLFEHLLALSRGESNVAADASVAAPDFRSETASQNARREEHRKNLQEFQRHNNMETDHLQVERALNVLSGSQALMNLQSDMKARHVTDSILRGESVSQTMQKLQGTATSEFYEDGVRCTTTIIRSTREIPGFIEQGFYILIKEGGVSINDEKLPNWQNLAVESKTSFTVPATLFEKRRARMSYHLSGKIYTPVPATTINSSEVSVFVKLMFKLSAQPVDKKKAAMLQSSTHDGGQQIDISNSTYHFECCTLKTGVSVYSNPHHLINLGQESSLYSIRFIITSCNEFGNVPGVIQEDFSRPCDQERSGHQWRFINICGSHSYQNCYGYYRLCLIPKSIPRDQLAGYIASLAELYPYDKDITDDIFGRPDKTQNIRVSTFSECWVANFRKSIEDNPKHEYSLPAFVSAKELGTVRLCERDGNNLELNMKDSLYYIPKDTFKAMWSVGKNKTPNTFAPYSALKKVSKHAPGLSCDLDNTEHTDFFTSNLEPDNRIVKQELIPQIVEAVAKGKEVDHLHIAAAAAVTAREFVSPVVCIDYCNIYEIPFECKFTDVEDLMRQDYQGPLLCHCWENTPQVGAFHKANLLITDFFEKIILFPTESGLNLAHLVFCMLKLLLMQYNMPDEQDIKKKNLFLYMETVSGKLKDQFKWKDKNMSVITVDYTIIAVLMHVFLTIIRTLDFMYCVPQKLPVTCWNIASYNRSLSVEDIFKIIKGSSINKNWSEAKIAGLPLKFSPAHVIMILAGWHQAQKGTHPESIDCFKLTGNLVEDANEFIKHVQGIVQQPEYHPLYESGDPDSEFQPRTYLEELLDENVYSVGDESIFTSFVIPDNWGIPGKFINHGDVPVYERLHHVVSPSHEEGAAAAGAVAAGAAAAGAAAAGPAAAGPAAAGPADAGPAPAAAVAGDDAAGAVGS